MNTEIRRNRLYCVLFLLVCLCGSACAYSLRQFTSKEGLSNSAILSVCQDSDGLLWIGTCDGMNLYDGNRLWLYQPADVRNSLSGNLIDGIMEGDDHTLWIQTNYGLDRLDTHHQTVKTFREFKDVSILTKSRDNAVFIMKDDGYIYYCCLGEDRFHRLETERFAFEEVLTMTVDKEDVLWVFTSDTPSHGYKLQRQNGKIQVEDHRPTTHSINLLCAFSEQDNVFFVDAFNELYEYKLHGGQTYYIADLTGEINKRGEISSIVRYHNDFFIGFKNSGLICLKYQPDRKVKYEVVPIDINSGIFCLMKDKAQDILWIGTDGRGLYMYFADGVRIENTLLDAPLYHNVGNPVRTLLLDDERTLWVGTKGNGILRMPGYDIEQNRASSVEQYLSGNSSLADNSVYCFASGRKGYLWIGGESGMNYYSYRDRKIHPFRVIADGKPLKFVHSVCEFNDSVLWIATVGEGIVKVVLDYKADIPRVLSAQRILLDDGKRASNYFFTSYKENDSIIWFGNRGKGACRVNVETGKITSYRFDGEGNSRMQNDIFAIMGSNGSYWFGTSFGLMRWTDGKYQVFNNVNKLPNNTIHGILEDMHRNLWLSTNRGIVKLNIKDNTLKTYDERDGLEIIEFSDGAYFEDKLTGTLFWGGVNGFLTITESRDTPVEYMPPLLFNNLSIFGKTCNIYDYLVEEEGRKVLELDYNQNFFGLSFTALDYIYGNNYIYLYKVEGLSDNWVENGFSPVAAFSSFPPGEYVLHVKYINPVTGNESEPQSLKIRINPPWYMTTLAYVVYILLAFVLIALLGVRLIMGYHRKRDAMIDSLNRRQRDELYESKLRFFINITHEFSTPLTLIYGPCERIIAHAKDDAYIQKYASMILQNARKLNQLIQELIEFRRLETGNKVLEIRPVRVSEYLKSIYESFTDMAERRHVDYQQQIEPDVRWNTDAGCLNKIVTNLISNAFKYTSDEGRISVEMSVDRDRLHITVSNTGKGIPQEDMERIFDRYKILDNFEQQSRNGTSRNGLGLAICHSMVTMLNGEIRVSSEPGRLTSFEVILPELQSNAESVEQEKEFVPSLVPVTETPVESQNADVAFDSSKLTVMVIDDDPSVRCLVTEILSNKYNVLSMRSSEEALEMLKQKQPGLIISDVMMPGMDGISLVREIKSDKLLSHIPLILLSALHDGDEQVKGIEAGAEAYVTKPFKVDYLEQMVERLIRREAELKEYYSSVFSVFSMDSGRLLHKEDKLFFDQVVEVIGRNIENPDLSVDLLSSILGFSTRQFYRKLKSVTDQTPADIIRDLRIVKAEQLLVTTHLLVEEVMYKVGFTNRGTFYKLFSARYGMTPRQYREEKKKECKTAVQSNELSHR